MRMVRITIHAFYLRPPQIRVANPWIKGVVCPLNFAFFTHLLVFRHEYEIALALFTNAIHSHFYCN